jgi:FkbH-like protein
MIVPPEARAVLENRSAPLAQVMKAVAAAERACAGVEEVVIGVSASVTVDLLGLFLRREALLAGVRARIVAGGYDDPIGDIERFAAEGVERVVLLPFFDNILPSFEAQIGALSPEAVEDKAAELGARYRLALERAKGFKSVQLGLYHRLGVSASLDGADAVDAALGRLNTMLREAAAEFPNVQLFDVAPSVEAVGRDGAYDLRFYFRAKAPYSAALLSNLAARLAAGTRSFGAKFYKVLALDCDNTLWGGIVGEDQVEGIKLAPYDHPGNVYWRVQQVISSLEKQGLILCLCTKNNPADVDEVFRTHPNMVLTERQIAAKRVNWTDKVANLQALAEELNLGLDSFIFLDDSPVEAEAVRARLPMVKMVQVPAVLTDYPAAIAEVERLFLSGGVSADGRSKTEQYRARAAAAEAQAAFASHEEYLASLGLEAEIHVDRSAEASRISELSLKSNQFNLTTRRYSVAEVAALMAADDAEVLSVTVRNRFGDSGLTGVIVLSFRGATARVENFLMSCRVLGQGIEFSLWAAVLDRCRARGASTLEADFLATAKNAQVRDFYDRLGLARVGDDDDARRYSRPLAGFAPPSSPWVKVSSA